LYPEIRRRGEMAKAPVQTTPGPSSLGFAALLCKELRKGKSGSQTPGVVAGIII
jgi:hypothetical protein